MNIIRALSKVVRHVAWAFERQSPEILTACAVSGTVATTYLAIKGTIKAVRTVDEEKEERGVENLSFLDIVKLTWKIYLPTIIILLISLICGIASCKEAGRRIAALSTSYQAATALLENHREVEREIVGDKKADEIEAAVAQKRVSGYSADLGIYHTKYGNTLFKDEFTGVMWRSSVEAVKDQIRDYSNAVYKHECLDIGSLHTRWGIPDYDSHICKNYGWNESMPEFAESVRFESGKLPYTEEPYLTLIYYEFPSYVYDDQEHSPYRLE